MATLPAVGLEPSPDFVAGGTSAARLGDTVLLVEDDPILARLLIVLLGRCSVQVLHAESGAECQALFAVHRESIALVVMDCGLPDVHGGTLCHRLRVARPGLAVLLTSGRSQDALCALLAADGPTRFLAKPFRPVDVVGAVQSLLGAGAVR
jgi:hypothetical protein